MDELIIKNEIVKHHYHTNLIKDLEKIQIKDGIFVYRFSYLDQFCVIKYFLNKVHAREIHNYKILMSLNIPTIPVYSMNESSIILEDITKSKQYRLGNRSDLENPNVARGLVKWYKKFHQKGKQYFLEFPKCVQELYNEYETINLENINRIKNKIEVNNENIWSLLFNHFNLIEDKLKTCINTLTYNDFYFTNFIVALDETEVIMFDYNYLGKGFVYSDLRNVLSNLKGDAKKIFLENYQQETLIEKYLDEVMSPLFSLHKAYERDVFPRWAEEDLDKFKNGTYETYLKRLIELL